MHWWLEVPLDEIRPNPLPDKALPPPRRNADRPLCAPAATWTPARTPDAPPAGFGAPRNAKVRKLFQRQADVSEQPALRGAPLRKRLALPDLVPWHAAASAL